MGTHYQGSAEAVRALDVYIKLSRAAETVTARINQHLKAENLTISQFGVLEAIYHLGPMHQNQLASKILKTSGNLTLVIDNLEKRKLVERRRDLGDRRCMTVQLTQTGRELIGRIFPRHASIVVNTIGVLSHEEQAQIAALCRKLGLAQSGSNLPRKTPETRG